MKVQRLEIDIPILSKARRILSSIPLEDSYPTLLPRSAAMYWPLNSQRYAYNMWLKDGIESGLLILVWHVRIKGQVCFYLYVHKAMCKEI